MLLGPVVALCFFSQIHAFFFDFGGHSQQQEFQQQQVPYEDTVLNKECKGYVCRETQECVSQPSECSCPFPKSQLKCQLPGGQYVCISKPATHDEKLNKIYDDASKGSKAKNKGIRDCGWVEAAYKRLV